MRSASRLLDFLGDGERRSRSRKGRELVEDLRDKARDDDGVFFAGEGMRSRDRCGGSSLSMELVILAKREADLV